jgi:hypothetical protein
MDDVVLDDLSQSNDGISDDDDCIEVGFLFSTTGLQIRSSRGAKSWRAVDAHNGGLEAPNRALEGL